ncbi:MAG: cbb3-type cytochrome oxidase assembly protein CcoS [Desulfobacterales bacterium]|nr:cbb3-type cytochrome oxidase assembly protein CcoS [Desulfobacterales bacterium]
MYYPYFIAYMIIGFAISIPVFLWALKNGQFSDQQRAGYLPLEPESDGTDTGVSKIHRLEIYALFVLIAMGLAASASVLVFAILNA